MDTKWDTMRQHPLFQIPEFPAKSLMGGQHL